MVLPRHTGMRIWNPQSIRYAGYRQVDGSIVGDSDQIEFTKICQHFGWHGQGTQFDVLPLIIQMPGQKPQLFELPKEVVLANSDRSSFTKHIHRFDTSVLL